MPTKMTPGRRAASVLPVLALAALLLSACSSGENNTPNASQSTTMSAPASSTAPSTATSPTSPGASLTGDAAAVAQAWTTFFDGKTSADQKVALLQNGQQFQQLIEAQAGSQLAQSTGATVSDVVVNGDQATVSYSVTLGGQPALTDQKGQAVREGGQWKVSDASFCQLLALESGGDTSKLPPACAAAGGSGSPAA